MGHESKKIEAKICNSAQVAYKEELNEKRRAAEEMTKKKKDYGTENC